jgi:hypothetical protein
LKNQGKLKTTAGAAIAEYAAVRDGQLIGIYTYLHKLIFNIPLLLKE